MSAAEGALRGARYAVEIVREALASARSQLFGSVAVVLVVAALCATVLLTTGRAVGAEDAVLASVDDAGTRTLVVRAQPDAGVDTAVLDDLDRIDAVSWAGAFSEAHDVRNAAVPGGTPVPLRELWTHDLEHLGIVDDTPVDGTVHASPVALADLALSTGAVVDPHGTQRPVARTVQVPEELESLEPLALIASGVPADPESFSILVVVTTTPHVVEPVRETLVSLLAVEDPATLTITTSDDLALLHDVVAGQLRSYSQSLVVGALVLALLLIAAVQTGVVLLRRKDYGRRRALGASQSLIVALVLTQSVALAALGAAGGSLVALATLAVSGQPLPGADFVVAVGVLTVGVGTVAALLPALVAARRDPLTELRVP